MKWEKLGVVYVPDGRTAWMNSHAYLPTAIVLDNCIRVFLAFRDSKNIGRIGWVDFSTDGRFEIIAVCEKPCLDIGEPGAFDDNGVSPTTVVRIGDKFRCYYVGWQLTPRAGYLLFTGVAISSDYGTNFVRESTVPIFERSAKELIVRSGAFVLEHEGIWKTWYAAGSQITQVGQKWIPTYHLAYMESKDGLTWPREGKISLIPSPPDELGFGRPFVEVKDGFYKIWYSVRSRSRGYFIGYAESKDGIQWERQDNIGGLLPSPDGWESQMTAFPSIVQIKGEKYMFYNGNDYGASGVGAARLIG